MNTSIVKTCSIENCCNKTRSKKSKYCEKHYYRIRRNGTHILKKAKINPCSFKILTNETSWILGLIWSDGNLRKNRIMITSGDLNLLKRVKKILKGNNVCIKKRKNQKAWDFSFSDKIISERLRSFGLKERKSTTIDWPINLPDDFAWDFLRGIFDGDGHICLGKNNMITMGISSASEKFIKSIESFLKRNEIMFSTSGQKSKNGTVFKITISHKSSIKIYDKFYQNHKNKAFLYRKYKKFTKGFSRVPPKIGRPVGTATYKYNKNIQKKIINTYLNTLSAGRTGLIFNIDSTTILKILKRNNIPIMIKSRSIFKRLKEKTKKNIINDRNKGLTFKLLEKKYNLKRGVIRQILKQ